MRYIDLALISKKNEPKGYIAFFNKGPIKATPNTKTMHVVPKVAQVYTKQVIKWIIVGS
jgi:hypothetical protein